MEYGLGCHSTTDRSLDIVALNAGHTDNNTKKIIMQDTPAVAAAKAQHSALYGQIALSHAQVLKQALRKKPLILNQFTFPRVL